jgi:hypothetical protein
MLLRSQRLRHDVCQVVVCGNVGEFQLSSGVKVPAVVELHIDVFVPALPVSSCLDVLQRAIGVGADGERGSEISDDILVELGKPLSFPNGFGAGDLFGFRSGECYHRLLVGLPRDWSAVGFEGVASLRLPSVDIS